MPKFIILFIVVPVVGLIVYLLSAPMPHEVGTYRLLDWLSVIGFAFGYFGLVASGYAALGVKQIADRYFAKARLPALRASINKLSEKLVASAETPAKDAISSTLLSEVAIDLSSLRRVRDYPNRKLVKAALLSAKELQEWIRSNRSTNLLLNECDRMWDLYRELSEIGLELRSKLDEDKVR